jgi:hypothetical protein
MIDRRTHSRRAGESSIAERAAAHLVVLQHALAHPELFDAVVIADPVLAYVPDPTRFRRCSDCHQDRDLIDFPMRPGGRHTVCAGCLSDQRTRHRQRLAARRAAALRRPAC